MPHGTYGPSLSDQGISPDDACCPHGAYLHENCRPCMLEAMATEEPRGVNPWPDLDDLEDLPY